MKNRLRWSCKKLIPVYNKFFKKKISRIDNTICYGSITYIIYGGIGDAILAYPAIRFLQKTYPASQLKIIVPTSLNPLLSAVFCEYTVSPMSSLFVLPIKGAFLRRGSTLSVTNATAVFSVAAELLGFFSGNHCCGFRYPDEHPSQRLFTESKVIDDNTHFAEQNIQLISESLHIPYNAGDIFLPSRTGRGNDPLKGHILIHPGSKKGYENKRWPEKNFNEIIKRLTEKGHRITILLGPDDDSLNTHFSDNDNTAICINPAIPDLIHLYHDARFFIGNDSGPAHLAAFYGIPGITLFGPEGPHRSAPCGKTSITIYNSIDCSPCHFSQNACYDNRCMKSITPDQVWKEVKKHLPHG